VFFQIGLPSFPGVFGTCKAETFEKCSFLFKYAPTCAVFLEKVKVLLKVTEINKDIDF